MGKALVIIVIDRCLVITRCRLYDKYITMKALYIIIATELALTITAVTLMTLTRELRVHPTEFDFRHALQLISQIIFMLVEASLHGSLLE